MYSLAVTANVDIGGASIDTLADTVTIENVLPTFSPLFPRDAFDVFGRDAGGFSLDLFRFSDDPTAAGSSHRK